MRKMFVFAGGREKINGVPVLSAELNRPYTATPGAAGDPRTGTGASCSAGHGHGGSGETGVQWLQCCAPASAANQGG